MMAITTLAELLEEQQAAANCRNYGFRPRRRALKAHEIAWDIPSSIWRGPLGERIA